MADNNLESELIFDTAKLIEEFKKQLIEILINERGLKPDSNTIKSLHVVMNESSKYVSLQGVEYIYYVIHGRGPGRYPPPNPLTKKWEIPFPIAKKLAEVGNKSEMEHVASVFDLAYQEFFKKIKKKAGKTALAYALRIGTLRNIG